MRICVDNGEGYEHFFAKPQHALRPVLEELAPTSFDCEGKTFYSIDNFNVSVGLSCCRFLAGLDPLLLGYEKTESILLPMGFGIFTSGFFTALNDGLTSALIAVLRTLVFQTAAVLLLPRIFDINEIWFSVVAAEFMSLLGSFFLILKRNKYHYS